MSNKSKLVYWINERENIRRCKEAGFSAPWSEDPVFQKTYFCNVRREDDKVTRFIRNYYGIENQAMNTAFNMLIARLVNKPSSLMIMGWPFYQWDSRDRDNFLDVMSKKGTWGSAYIVSTNGRAMPKHEYICELLTAALEQIPSVPLTSTLGAAHTALMAIHGLGSFMAAQIVADCKNTNGCPLQHAPDWWSWSAHGPGSLRGASWFLDRKVTPSTWNRDMYEIRGFLDKVGIQTICAQDIQNCLCEFDKYMRVSTGTGRSKRNYNGN